MTRAPTRRPWFSTAQLTVLGAALAFVVTAIAISFSHRPTAVATRAPVIVPTGRSDATAVLEPTSFSEKQQQEAYAAAREVSAVLNQLYCWCHCKESTIFHHRSLLECFESDHASQCRICMGEAILARKMVKSGVTDVRQIQSAIDAQFGPSYRGT
jgi:uncharacterized protein with PCYCGC motif